MRSSVSATSGPERTPPPWPRPVRVALAALVIVGLFAWLALSDHGPSPACRQALATLEARRNPSLDQQDKALSICGR